MRLNEMKKVFEGIVDEAQREHLNDYLTNSELVEQYSENALNIYLNEEEINFVHSKVCEFINCPPNFDSNDYYNRFVECFEEK